MVTSASRKVQVDALREFARAVLREVDVRAGDYRVATGREKEIEGRLVAAHELDCVVALFEPATAYDWCQLPAADVHPVGGCAMCAVDEVAT